MEVKKILLADDDADDREIFQRVLSERNGVQLIDSLENGREVIEFLNSITTAGDMPHLIILDQNMPKMTGIETLSILKSDEKYSHIDIVIYSTYSDRNLIEKCRNLGATMVLSKPSSMKEYEAVIDQFLSILN